MKEKYCKHCNQFLPVESFYYFRTTNVYSQHCKACTLAVRAEKKLQLGVPTAPLATNHKGVPIRKFGNGFRIIWTPAMIETLKEKFADTDNQELADLIGIHVTSMLNKARVLRLTKSKAFRSAQQQKAYKSSPKQTRRKEYKRLGEKRTKPDYSNRPVVAVRPDGGVAMYFNCPSEAIHQGGINAGNLYAALRKEARVAGGYMWYFRDEHERLWFENPEQLKWTPSPLHAYFRRGYRKGAQVVKGKKFKLSEETLQKRRDVAALLNDRMRETNGWNISRKPIVCIETGEVYPSLKACSESISCPLSSLHRHLNNGSPFKGKHYEYKNPNRTSH